MGGQFSYLLKSKVRNAMKLLALALALRVAIPLAAQLPEPKIIKPEKPQKETTQTLDVPRELPLVVTAETRKLSFQVTPLSAKGLLSQQIRDALRWLFRETRGETIVKLRAFVAGSGDLRRVPALVSEMFSERRLPLPVVSVVQAGRLPLEGAQVLFEAVVQEKKDVNPSGLAFLSAQSGTADEPLQPLAPVAEKALARLRVALKSSGVEGKNVLRAACFTSSLDGMDALRRLVAGEFPTTALAFVQAQRAPAITYVACEATARLDSPPAGPVEFRTPEELGGNGFASAAALIGAKRVAFTGTQLAFGYDAADARLAFERLGRALKQATTSSPAFVTIYPISNSVAALVRKTQPEFFDRAKPPAGMLVPFEALASVDAAFAIDAIAAVSDSKEP